MIENEHLGAVLDLCVSTLGWAQWNLSRFDFIFDVKNEKNQSGKFYSYIMRKVWYHQIWIQNYLGFIVLILM